MYKIHVAHHIALFIITTAVECYYADPRPHTQRNTLIDNQQDIEVLNVKEISRIILEQNLKLKKLTENNEKQEDVIAKLKKKVKTYEEKVNILENRLTTPLNKRADDAGKLIKGFCIPSTLDT